MTLANEIMERQICQEQIWTLEFTTTTWKA